MPTNIPGTASSYPANVVAPSDGDQRNAASMQVALTQLADRTAWLRDQIDGAGTGVERIRTVADFTALAAITAPNRADGDFAVVVGFGLYRFSAASLAQTDGVAAIEPAAGAGCWLWQGASVGPIPRVAGRVQCAGTTPTKLAASGLTLPGIGFTPSYSGNRLRITFATAMPDADYLAQVNAYSTGGAGPLHLVLRPVISSAAYVEFEARNMASMASTIALDGSNTIIEFTVFR